MLSRYEEWRSKYFLPPLRPWDGQSGMDAEQSATVPGDGPLPGATEALGTSVRLYYNNTYRAILTGELADEVSLVWELQIDAGLRDALAQSILAALTEMRRGLPPLEPGRALSTNWSVLSAVSRCTTERC